MYNLLIYIMATLGLIHIVTDSILFAGIRNKAIEALGEFYSYPITCQQCCGFYAGFIVAYLMGMPCLILMALAGSFLGYASSIIINRINYRGNE